VIKKLIFCISLTEAEEEEAMRRVRRMSKEGQLWRMCSMPQRQKSPNLQDASL
jgi:hypothetical protein